MKRNLFLSLIDKYFAEKIHCKDLSFKYLAPNKALFSFPALGVWEPGNDHINLVTKRPVLVKIFSVPL